MSQNKYLIRSNDEMREILDQLRELAYPSDKAQDVPQNFKDSYEEANRVLEARSTVAISHTDRDAIKKALTALKTDELKKQIERYTQDVDALKASRDASAGPSIAEKNAQTMLSSAKVVELNKGGRRLI